MMAAVLLTVSGEIARDTAAQIARGERPRADYFELARACDADLIDYAEARRSGGVLGRLIERVLGTSALLVWACFRRHAAYQAIFSDGEQIGLPLALLLKLVPTNRRPRHLMIAHVLSVKKKLLFFDLLRVQRQIDRILVYASHQRAFALRRWRLPEQQVVWTPFMVDTRFFAPEAVRSQPGELPQLCAVGLEMRDYPTLLRAAAGLPARVVIAAASPWSKRSDSTCGQAIPDTVTVRRFSQYELRQLYANCRFLVMPLYNVDFQAGVTAILEAMAMGRAVICTRTPGQTDVVIEGETGLYVPPGDVAALRHAIERLLADPALAERMGQAGRRRVEQLMSLDHYAERLGGLVRATLAEGRLVATTRVRSTIDGERV